MSEKINNAITTLDWDLLSSWMLFIVKSWEWDLFDTVDYPYKLTIEQYQGTLIKKREVLTIENRTGDAFTVSERASEACVQDETISPKVRTQNALSFLSWDTVRMTITEEDWNETQEEIFTNIPADLDLKLNITDFQNQTAIYGSSSTWTDAYAITLSPVPSALVDLKWAIFFLADVWNTWPATLNINWLWAKTIKKKHDQDLETGDIEISQKVQVVYNSVDDVFEMISEVASVVNVSVGNLQYNWYTAWLDMLEGQPYRKGINTEIDRIANLLQPTGAATDTDQRIWYDTTYYETWMSTTYLWTVVRNIAVNLKKQWSPTFILNMEIYSDAWFTALLWTSTNTLNVSTLTTSFAVIQFDFNDIVVPSTFYYKLNIVSWSPSTSNYVWSWVGFNVYANWTGYRLTSAGTPTSTWYDQYFEVNKGLTTQYEDIAKKYKAKATATLNKVEWYVLNTVSKNDTFISNFGGIQWGYTGLTAWLEVFLQADWSVSHTQTNKKLWLAVSTTQILSDIQIFL